LSGCSTTKAYAPEGNQPFGINAIFTGRLRLVQVSSLMGQIPYTPSGDGKKQFHRHKIHNFNVVLLISVRNDSS